MSVMPELFVPGRSARKCFLFGSSFTWFERYMILGSEYAISILHDGKVVHRAIYLYTDSRFGKVEYFVSKHQVFPSITIMIAYFRK